MVPEIVAGAAGKTGWLAAVSKQTTKTQNKTNNRKVRIHI
jgi:hypothetical protein